MAKRPQGGKGMVVAIAVALMLGVFYQLYAQSTKTEGFQVKKVKPTKPIRNIKNLIKLNRP